MMGRVNEIRLTAKQRRALEKIVSRPSEAAGVVRRARVVLLSDEQLAASEIATRLGLSAEGVSRIRRRFLEAGIGGLADQPKAGRKDHALSADTVDRIVNLAMSPPPAGRSRWTTRLLAKEFGITSGAVSDCLRRREMKPHLVRTYKVSRDPEFAAKVKDVVGMYLNPPEYAIVLSMDDKTRTTTLKAGRNSGYRGHLRLRVAPERASLYQLCSSAHSLDHQQRLLRCHRFENQLLTGNQADGDAGRACPSISDPKCQ